MPQPIRLVVTDMDGTLLDENRQLPADFALRVQQLEARGIAWAIASGRQYDNLAEVFSAAGVYPDIIAENGALAFAAHETEPFFCDLTPASFFRPILEAALTVPRATPVLCGVHCAWVADSYPENFEAVSHYFSKTERWHALSEIASLQVCKVAVYHPEAAAVLWPVLAPLCRPDLAVIRSSPYWIDVQPMRINKGRALAALLCRFSLAPEQVVVFGDYLNDLEMMTLGTHSVAMGNAHPELAAHCAHRALSNRENGVMRYLEDLGLFA